MRRILWFLSSSWLFALTASQGSFNIPDLFTPKPVQIYTPATTTSDYCKTDDDKAGVCVMSSLCVGNVALTSGVPNFIFSKNRIESTCPTGEICCQSSSVTNPPVITTPYTYTTLTTSTMPSIIPPTPKIYFPTELGCGRGNPTSVRGIDDEVATFTDYPWVVPVFKVQRGVEKFIAGGSLIHPRLVLTYASKFVRSGTFFVRAGDFDILTTDERYNHQTIAVEKVIRHRNFSSGSMRNNIALLLLKSPAQPNFNIGYMCLPSASTRTPPGKECIVIGWGTETMINGTLRNEPKMMRVPVVDRGTCVNAIRPYTKPDYDLHPSELCAGGVDYWDVCKGDGGSPLFCEYPTEPNRYYQAGIVSWGVNCGGSLPSMYADVAALRPWIDATIASEGLDTGYFTP